MNRKYVFNLNEIRPTDLIGAKAYNLHRLLKQKYLIPTSFVCIWSAYFQFLENGPLTIKELSSELSQLINPNLSYAVRSSANVEDAPEFSYAGQFKTILNVKGIDQVVEAIVSVWENTISDSNIYYINQIKEDPKRLKMAVLIQEMIDSNVAGVVFSRNPITGMDEIVVEAVRGSGTLLVQDGVSPYRWVRKWGKWLEQPSGGDNMLDLITEVSRAAKNISKTCKIDVDLEWVFDGKDLYWLQLREITAINEIKVYSNKIAKEMLPGMIKPLVWSVNVPMTNGVWIDLIEEVTGNLNIEPSSLAKAFYYRTYFDMATFGRIFESLGLPAESLERMMGIIPGSTSQSSFKMSPHLFLKLPKILKFLYDKWIFDKKIEINLPELQTQYQDLYKIQTGQMDELKIISYIDALNAIHRRMTYFNIVIPLLMQAYSAVLRSRLSTLDIDFNQFDLTLGMDELNRYDPTFQLHELAYQYKHLSAPDQKAITSCSYEEFLKLPGIEKFQSDVEAFLKTFGHISDSGTDFSYVPWRENRETLIKVIAGYNEGGRSKDGYKKIDDIQLKGLGGVLFKIIYHRARKYRLYREISSSNYIFGVGLYRTFYLALGNHFVSRGLIDQPEDIFYLNDNEIREHVTRKCEEDQFRFLINLRKTEMEQFSEMVLPDIIYGDTPPPAVEETEFKLVGTPTSRGYYTGFTRIIKGITEFNNLQQGEILVIPFSDVGWTPLFSKAGAVIAESGGILSHSSIIAREYNIPAVVSVSGAMQLKDSMLVTVDGFTGQVSIHHHENHISPSDYNQ